MGEWLCLLLEASGLRRVKRRQRREGVAHMQVARHIGRWNENPIRGSIITSRRGGLGVKIPVLRPGGPNHGLGGGWLVGFC